MASLNKVMPGTKERFLRYVTLTDANICWLWNGVENSNGYGRFSYKNKYILAHRFSYMLFVGEIKDGLNVCHSCDNRKCVNPTHLWLGTQSENLGDAVSKGRMYKPKTNAEKNGNTSLIWDDVRAIRKCHGNGELKVTLAKRFGVSPSTIANVIANRTWKESINA